MGSKQRKGSRTDLDRISALPNELKEKLLVLLPIKEAVKTSCLSSKWRYTWTYIPDLVFNTATLNLTHKIPARALELENIVDNVLLLHEGPIQKFTLNYDHCYLTSAVHRWMVVLSRTGVRELYVTFCKMPSSFFSTNSLTDVRLEKCVLKVPQSFNGLKLLKSLMLVYCSIGDKDLENLISSCSYLESLFLTGMYGMFVRITAPKLKHMSLHMDSLNSIHLITPTLVVATLDLRFVSKQTNYKKILEDTFGSLYGIQRLDITFQFMKFLTSAGNFPVKLSCLKELVCSMNPSSQKEIAFAVCMFQNAPSLETLQIFAQSTKPSLETFWEPTMPTKLFGNLKFVKIRYRQEDIAEFLLPLVKFLLATSPVLVSLHLAGPGAHENVARLNKLLGFKRASMEAQIFVESIRSL